MEHARLVDIHHELLVAHGEAALEPAGRVQHEVHAGEHRRQHGLGRFIGGLRIGDLGGAEAAAGAEGYAEPPRERRHDVEHQRGLGCAEGRRAGLHRHRRREAAEDHRCAGVQELHERHARERLGQGLGGGAGDGHRRHRTRQDERRDEAALVGARVDLERAQHGRVVGHRRVDVDEADERGVRLAGQRVEVAVAHRDLRHLHRIGGALGRGHRAHERLVAVLDVAVQHVEVALVDRQVDGLADRAARVVQRVRHVGELHEVAEVLDARVATALVEVAHEGRAVGRREHRRIAADAHIARRVAGDLRELAGRMLLDQFAAHAARESHAFAVDLRARFAEDVEDLGILAELDTGLLEDAVGIAFDDREPRIVQHLEARDPPHDVGRGRGAAGRTGRALGVPGVRASGTRGCCGGVGHGQKSMGSGSVGD